MGYYSNYSLSFEPDNEETRSRFKSVYEAEDQWQLRYAVDEEGDAKDRVKWYEWEEDMLRVSALLPDLLFTLHGEGEETGDIWNAYFLGGKIHWAPAQIIFPPFDPSKLASSREASRDLQKLTDG